MIPTDIDADVMCENTLAIDRAEWLELRRLGLGGSDMPAALGLSPYATPVSLFYDKIEPAEDVDTELFQAGRRMEEPIAKWFSDETGYAVQHIPVMLRSKSHYFMLANVDRFVLAVPPDDDPDHPVYELCLLECKNVDISKADEWRDGPPLYARVQTQHYLFVTGLRRAFIAALIGGRKFVWFEVWRDDEMIANLVARGEAFWTMVTMGRCPEIDGSDVTRAALKRHWPTALRDEVEMGPEIVAMVHARTEAKAAQEAARKRLSRIENEMIAAIGDAAVVTHNGRVVATYKEQTRREHTVKESTFRVLRVMTPKGEE